MLHRAEHVGLRAVALLARAAATTSALVTPAGICLLMQPEKIRLVASPSSRGPSTVSVTLAAASTRLTTTSSRCGASMREQPPAGARGS